MATFITELMLSLGESAFTVLSIKAVDFKRIILYSKGHLAVSGDSFDF